MDCPGLDVPTLDHAGWPGEDGHTSDSMLVAPRNLDPTDLLSKKKKKEKNKNMLKLMPRESGLFLLLPYFF